MVEKISSWIFIQEFIYLLELRKHVHGFYVSQTSIIHFIRFRYLVVFRIIYMFPLKPSEEKRSLLLRVAIII